MRLDISDANGVMWPFRLQVGRGTPAHLARAPCALASAEAPNSPERFRIGCAACAAAARTRGSSSGRRGAVRVLLVQLLGHVRSVRMGLATFRIESRDRCWCCRSCPVPESRAHKGILLHGLSQRGRPALLLCSCRRGVVWAGDMVSVQAIKYFSAWMASRRFCFFRCAFSVTCMAPGSLAVDVCSCGAWVVIADIDDMSQLPTSRVQNWCSRRCWYRRWRIIAST
jgi:hypothetical protein